MLLFGCLSRYMSIFHQAILNSLDERIVVLISRSFVTMVSLFMPLLVDMTKSIGFVFLTNQNPNEANKAQHAHIRIFILVEVIFIIFVQLRIELYERNCQSQQNSIQNNLDATAPDNEVEEHAEDEESAEPNDNKIRVVFWLLFGVLLFHIIWLFTFRSSTNDVITSRLKMTLVLQIVLCNVIPLILIYRNPNMWKFFKHVIRSLLPKCRKSNSVHVP